MNIATVEYTPHQSSRTISSQLGVPRMSVWRALNFKGLYPYHIHPIQHLEPQEYDIRLQFFRWINAHLYLFPLVLFTDGAQFTHDRVNNMRNIHSSSPENPHDTTVSNFQNKFSINVWCSIIFNKLTGPHIFEGSLTG
jgi:hypothetical protein